MNKKVEYISKRYPILKQIPESERLKVFNRSNSHPLFWAILIGLFSIWFFIYGAEIIQLSGNIFSEEKGLISKSAIFFKKAFFPAILPGIIIISTMWKLKGLIIKRIIHKEY